MYRYGFNGKENDLETGEQDYGMRMYDSKVPHFLSIDPIANKYPELSPYIFASDRPVQGTDRDGLELNVHGILRTHYPILMGISDGVEESLRSSWSFVTRDAWKGTTWIELGRFAEESTLSLSTVQVVSTPRVDAAVDNFKQSVINGDSYDRSKFAGQLSTDIAIGLVGDKGLSKLKMLSEASQISRVLKTIQFTEKELGLMGEIATKTTVSEIPGTAAIVPHQYFKIPKGLYPERPGGRFMDVVKGRLGFESKVGYKILDGEIKGQIAKDKFLLQSKGLDQITWIFYESPQTGVGGAAKNLIKELKKAGIKTEFRKLPEDAIRKSLDK